MAAKTKERSRKVAEAEKVFINYPIRRDLRDKLKADAALHGREIAEHLEAILDAAVGYLSLSEKPEAVAR